MLGHCHAARRSGEPAADELRRRLFELSEELAASAVDVDALNSAWAAIDATMLRRAARRLVGDKACGRALVRDRRQGWQRVERELRNDPALPTTFRANPAQHFYALQIVLSERRRQQWSEACDLEPDAFELAA